MGILSRRAHPRRVHWNAHRRSCDEIMVQSHFAASLDSSQLYFRARMDRAVRVDGIISFEDRQVWCIDGEYCNEVMVDTLRPQPSMGAHLLWDETSAVGIHCESHPRCHARCDPATIPPYRSTVGVSASTISFMADFCDQAESIDLPAQSDGGWHQRSDGTGRFV